MSEFQVHDLSSNHIYRTELPNIIFEIGLSPSQLAVYAVIKRIAGDQRDCWKSYQKIADQANMGRSTIIPIIDSLCLLNPILGKSLISKKSRIHESGDKDTNIIIINDIWPDNYIHFKEKFGGSPESGLGSSKSGLGSPESESGVVQNLDEGSPESGHKEEPFKKNPLEEDIARSEAKPPPSTDFFFNSSKNKYEGITPQDKEDWKKLYPDIDIDKEILKSEQWIVANPSKSKKKLWRKFLTGWFQRGNDTAYNKKAYTFQSKPGEDRRTKTADGKPADSPSAGRF